MTSILTIFGTRPEIIKLAPVIRACESAGLGVVNLYTGQQPDLGDPLLEYFGINISHRTEVMTAGQTIASLLARTLHAIDPIVQAISPGAVVVQGDTTSALAGAMAAEFHRVPIVHVEAGLRTGDKREPFPEETNRCLISRLATIHCAPTNRNVRNLLDEGTDPQRVFQTGNPIVDAIDEISSTFDIGTRVKELITAQTGKIVILATAHRRENFGTTLDTYLRELHNYVEEHENVVLLFPVHPNPNVRDSIRRNLPTHPRIELLPPLGYPDFLALMRRANVIVSDSGGVQEEAASVATPLLVLRSKTERPEAVVAGIAKLVPDPASLQLEIDQALGADPQRPARTEDNPFGDGRSGQRIARHIVEFLSSQS